MSPTAIAFLVILGIVVFLIWRESKRETDGINPKLLHATRGNQSLARRLLDQTKIKYPGKSERWYVEKVIYDLERDHGGSRGRRSRFQVNQRDLREKIFLIGGALWVFNSLISTIDRLLRR